MKAKTFALGLAVALTAIPATAHHSFDGTFDRNKLIKLSGKVSEFRFTNPHTYIILDVTGADGRPQQWWVETSAANGLGERGWTPKSIKVGEALTVDGWTAKDGKLYLRMRSMSHADGTAIGPWVPPAPTPLPGA